MKKFLTLIFLITVFTSNSLFAQLIIGSWQLQNPIEKQQSKKIIISDNSFELQITDLVTQEHAAAKLSCKIENETELLLTGENNQSAPFKVTWINNNKFQIIDGNSNPIYARSGSSDDKYLSKYLGGAILRGIVGALINSANNNQENNQNTYDQSEPAPRQNNTCRACLGTGQCPVCHGVRTVTYFGNSKPCKDCTDGKCFHCHGSGKQ